MLHRLVPSSSQDDLAGIDGDDSFKEMADIMAGEKSPQSARSHRARKQSGDSDTSTTGTWTSPPASPASKDMQNKISKHLAEKSSMEREAMLAALKENDGL